LTYEQVLNKYMEHYNNNILHGKTAIRFSHLLNFRLYQQAASLWMVLMWLWQVWNSSYFYFKVVHTVHYLDQCTQFIVSTKCTVLKHKNFKNEAPTSLKVLCTDHWAFGWCNEMSTLI